MDPQKSSELSQALALLLPYFRRAFWFSLAGQPAGAGADRLHAGGLRPCGQQPQPLHIADADRWWCWAPMW